VYAGQAFYEEARAECLLRTKINTVQVYKRNKNSKAPDMHGGNGRWESVKVKVRKRKRGRQECVKVEMRRRNREYHEKSV
jgi:hypothetical protein